MVPGPARALVCQCTCQWRLAGRRRRIEPAIFKNIAAARSGCGGMAVSVACLNRLQKRKKLLASLRPLLCLVSMMVLEIEDAIQNVFPAAKKAVEREQMFISTATRCNSFPIPERL